MYRWVFLVFLDKLLLKSRDFRCAPWSTSPSYACCRHRRVQRWNSSMPIQSDLWEYQRQLPLHLSTWLQVSRSGAALCRYVHLSYRLYFIKLSSGINNINLTPSNHFMTTKGLHLQCCTVYFCSAENICQRILHVKLWSVKHFCTALPLSLPSASLHTSFSLCQWLSLV